MRVKDPGSRLLRRRIKLEDCDCEVVLKKGAISTNADVLNRVCSRTQGMGGIRGKTNTISLLGNQSYDFI
jgi:hypothetical protein